MWLKKMCCLLSEPLKKAIMKKISFITGEYVSQEPSGAKNCSWYIAGTALSPVMAGSTTCASSVMHLLPILFMCKTFLV